MASTQFYQVKIAFDSGPDDSGVISGSGSHSFGSDVLSAGASVAAFTVSYSNDHHVKTLGASVDKIQWSGTTVTVDASLQLEDDGGHVITKDVSSMEVLIMAWVEGSS